jgi:hypothetical protein
MSIPIRSSNKTNNSNSNGNSNNSQRYCLGQRQSTSRTLRTSISNYNPTLMSEECMPLKTSRYESIRVLCRVLLDLALILLPCAIITLQIGTSVIRVDILNTINMLTIEKSPVVGRSIGKMPEQAAIV